MASPLISVIVVCKNPGTVLRLALESVWFQTMQPELIVVDGASTDGTAAWLGTVRDRLSAFISESDKGVYDAMNKGVSLARGEWIVFLGADDRLSSATVCAESSVTLNATGASVVVGEAQYDDGRIYALAKTINPLARNFVHHQATFYRRSLFEQLGGFDPSLAVMGDYDFNLRLWKTGMRFKPISLRIAECTSNGLSDSGRWQGYREEIAVRHRYASARRCWVWDGVSLIRYGRKKLARLFPRKKRPRLTTLPA